MRVLYVNHTAAVSGGERSLLGLLAALDGRAEALLATPPGALKERAQAAGIATAEIVGTAGSLRLHPLHTSRALAEMAVAARQVRSLVARQDVQVAHANSIRAGIVTVAARAPVATVVHVRDCLPPGRVSDATMRVLSRATVVVANSSYTAESVLRSAASARVEVVANGIDLGVWDPGALDRAQARAALGQPASDRFLIGIVAQVTPWKGQDTAIEALALLCAQGIDAHLLIVGSTKFVAQATRFDNRAFAEALRAQVAEAGLDGRVSWLGEREDVPQLVRALDALVLPSTEEPFGRAVIEAMALEVPVVATTVGGPAEMITDGLEGFLRAPGDARSWAQALSVLAADPARAREMARAGRARVEQAYTIERHVASMIGVYERVVRIRRSRP
ncbi:MAG TPA: glycosyltransferase family 4 protein [Solirubrobacteraceae bacterium]|jgi:glycosyltransferase involved in cell wall biosynthesis|nr:glycosyltransferase family 4 protein [Solirubrobacteraceae bacterium]